MRSFAEGPCVCGEPAADPPAQAPPSEGLAELIERLCVAAFKGEATVGRIEPLCRTLGEETTLAVIRLAEANKALWQLKDEQAEAVRGREQIAERLLGLIHKDITLCEARAEIRAELNRRLGSRPSSESVKSYGGA